MVVGAAMAATALGGMAAESGHYIDGVEGLKAASLPPPGVYGRLYSVYYGASHLRDAGGDKVDPDFRVNVFAAVPRVIWITPLQILGANYGCDLIVPVVRTEFTMGAAGVKKRQTGLYDPCLEPVLLSWNRDRYDAAAGFGIYFPFGRYDLDDPSSSGKGFYTYLFTLGGTLYLDPERTWAASALGRYEIHGNKRNTDVRPGDDLHIEWGLSKNLAKVWEVGLAGYAHWQMTDDSGRDVTWDGSDHDRVFAAGPEIAYFVAPARLNVSVRYLQEFLARDDTEGRVAALTLTKIF